MVSKKSKMSFAPFGDFPGRQTWRTINDYYRDLDSFAEVLSQHGYSSKAAVEKWYRMENHLGPLYFERMKLAGHGSIPSQFFDDLLGVEIRKKLGKANARPVSKKAVRKKIPAKKTPPRKPSAVRRKPGR
jgi:hypothetical protein